MFMSRFYDINLRQTDTFQKTRFDGRTPTDTYCQQTFTQTPQFMTIISHRKY